MYCGNVSHPDFFQVSPPVWPFTCNLFPPRPAKTISFVILLCLMSDNFTCQGRKLTIHFSLFVCFFFTDEEIRGLMEEILSEDYERWRKADENKDLKLNKEEFLSFQHPEHNEKSIKGMAEDLMSQMDDNGDRVLYFNNTYDQVIYTVNTVVLFMQ